MPKGACGANLSTEKGRKLCLQRRKDGHRACNSVSPCQFRNRDFSSSHSISRSTDRRDVTGAWFDAST